MKGLPAYIYTQIKLLKFNLYVLQPDGWDFLKFLRLISMASLKSIMSMKAFCLMLGRGKSSGARNT
jgi:hypothetical protein